MNLEEIITKLQTMLDEKRFLHTLGVKEVAVELAHIYRVDPQQAALAALLHDCAKNLNFSRLFAEAEAAGLTLAEIDRQVPQLLHGPVGAILARKVFGITDEAVLQAVRDHTLGSANMSALDKIIYIADMIEPGRDYPAVNRLRRLARTNLDEAILACFDTALQYVISSGFLIHPRTIEARNAVLLSKRDKKPGY